MQAIEYKLAILIALLIGAPNAGWAAEGGRITASSSELVVEGWRLIMPSVSVDDATGTTWVRYDLPDGSYQSYPLDSGEPIVEKWYKPGVEGFNTTPGGYSVEDTEEIKNWYQNGGVGDFVIEDGNWVAVEPGNQQPVPADAPSAADNSSMAGASDADEDESGPFGGRVDPSAIQSVSTSPDAALQGLIARYHAAKKLCSDSPTNENCQKYYKIEAEYLEKMQGN